MSARDIFFDACFGTENLVPINEQKDIIPKALLIDLLPLQLKVVLHVSKKRPSFADVLLTG